MEFMLRSGDSAAETLGSIRSKLSAAALVTGIISLLGASTGLLNIMLVSVNERKREIGLRKAVGAKKKDISLQFLAEAAVIGMAGGLTGILTGIAGGDTVALVMGRRCVIPWGWAAIAIAISLATSLLSGIVPAMRAAALDPVESLRCE